MIFTLSKIFQTLKIDHVQGHWKQRVVIWRHDDMMPTLSSVWHWRFHNDSRVVINDNKVGIMTTIARSFITRYGYFKEIWPYCSEDRNNDYNNEVGNIAEIECTFNVNITPMPSGLLKSLTMGLFVQELVPVDKIKDINDSHYWLFVRNIYRWQVNTPNKRPVMWWTFLCFNVIIFICLHYNSC